MAFVAGLDFLQALDAFICFEIEGVVRGFECLELFGVNEHEGGGPGVGHGGAGLENPCALKVVAWLVAAEG